MKKITKWCFYSGLVFLFIFFGQMIFSQVNVDCGDANEDGSIDIVDALVTAQNSVGLISQPFNKWAANVNNDENVDIVDALLIAQAYVGFDVQLTCDPNETPPTTNVLYSIIQENIEAETIKGEPVEWTAEIQLNTEFLKNDTIKELVIILEDQEDIITLEHSGEIGRAIKWYGKIKDSPESLVMFIITNDDTVSGNITLASGEFYKIRYLYNGRYVLAKIDREKYKEDAPALKVANEIPIEMDPCPNTDSADSIDVMVIYSDDARAASGSNSSMLSEVYMAVELTNQAYINSNITQRINLVHTSEVSYAETGNYFTDITALRDPFDGTLDNVHTFRDNYSADIVVLILEDIGGPCGCAYVMETVSTAFEEWAFAVVDRGCASSNYSFAHELGHIMGARHDCDTTPELLPYDYAHGYYNTDPTPIGQPNWRTIMSYNTFPPSTRICYFSNPGITYPESAVDGDPMGETAAAGTCQSDNNLTLNNTALAVANFRCTSSNVDNVWMKDTWNDTGEEPDPNTVSESMSKSPYIWVRNEQDTDLVYHHQHQDAITGTEISNWIYVKLHNGGVEMTGDLEVYYANASISLSWPGGWTLIDNPTLNIGADSTEIIEIEWTGLPAAGGHYCLVARWNSTADPMHTSEGSSIGTNVRENNNIIWKNITIIETTEEDGPVSAYFEFNAIDKDSAIRIKCKDIYPYKAFSRYGILKIEFDEKTQRLLANWNPDSPDIVHEGNAYIIKDSLVYFKNLPFDERHYGRIKITFQALKETPKTLYYVDVSHITFRDNRELEIGNVAYIINTQLKLR